MIVCLVGSFTLGQIDQKTINVYSEEAQSFVTIVRKIKCLLDYLINRWKPTRKCGKVYIPRFTYLGCLNTYDLDSKKEILVRIAKATAALSAMDKIWKSTSIHKKLKLEVLKTCVFSGMLYGCEAWTITKVAEV